MKIVIDTNVLISGMLNPSGPPGRIVDLLRSDALQAVVDDRILNEYADVLRREYFLRYFTESEREDVIDYSSGIPITRYQKSLRTMYLTKANIPFLEIALSEGVPLITGNLEHFPERSRMGAISCYPGSLSIILLPRAIKSKTKPNRCKEGCYGRKMMFPAKPFFAWYLSPFLFLYLWQMAGLETCNLTAYGSH